MKVCKKIIKQLKFKKTMAITLNTLGLILDIIGVVILFKFGLPADVSKDGHIGMTFQGTNTDDIKKYKKYEFWSRFGLSLLILGFLLQIVSNYIEHF